MTVRFKGTELRPVLAEAVANQRRVILVRIRAYFLAERGERRPDGRQKTIAHAAGCNPDVDAFDDWWSWRAPSSVATTSASSSIRRRACLRASRSEGRLDVSATATHLSLQAVLPRPAVTDRHPWPRPGPFFPAMRTAASADCRCASAPSWRDASGYVPLTSVSDMPRQPRSSKAATRFRPALITPVRTGIHARTAIGSRWRCHQTVPSTHAGFTPSRLGRVCLRLIVPQEIHHDHFHRKSYFDLHITGLGYLNRIREVKPKKGDAFPGSATSRP